MQTLIETLEKEHEALIELADALEHQLQVVRQKDLSDLETATHQTSEAATRLDQVSTKRQRQMQLVARMLDAGDDPTLKTLAEAARAANKGSDEAPQQLRSLRSHLHEQAHRVQEVSEELEYALQYAAAVGRKMIAFLRGGPAQPAAQGYTERGQSSAPDTQSTLNQIG